MDSLTVAFVFRLRSFGLFVKFTRYDYLLTSESLLAVAVDPCCRCCGADDPSA
ncbi:hypothetical protein GE21DRAFT_1288532 [Neurospora crassa]|nr:hypothetical protein GE21DRAFT_1288532 [Neurospora crassa]